MATPTKKILLTGFEPFGNMATNPSEELVRRLAEYQFESIELNTMILPVEYHRAMDIIREQVGQYDIIVMFGVARSRQEVSVERVAINLMDATSTDNAGYRPDEETIASNGPTAYFSTLPIKQVVAYLKEHGITCKISNSAGTYVCNAVYYAALHQAATRGLDTKCVFIHLPLIFDVRVVKTISSTNHPLHRR